MKTCILKDANERNWRRQINGKIFCAHGLKELKLLECLSIYLSSSISFISIFQYTGLHFLD